MRTVVVGMGVLQAWLLFAATPKLIVWPDSIGYIGPAADAIERGEFTHWAGRGSGYAAFLWPLLALRPEPSTIIQAQRMLVLITYAGVAAVVVLLAKESRLAERIGPRPLAAVAACWLGAFVLYPPVSGLAHALMPEVLFACLLSLVMAGTVTQTLPRLSKPAAAGIAAATIAVSVALALVKPHWWAAAVALPVAMPLLSPATRRPLIAAVVVVALTVSGVALFGAERRLQARHDAYTSQVFGARTLFCNNSDLVHGYLSRQSDPVATTVATSLATILTPEARAKAIGWGLMGFDGDACSYGEPARVVASLFPGRPGDEASFYVSTYLRALASRPAYLVAREARHALALVRKPFNATGGDYFLRADRRVMDNNRSTRPLFERWMAADPGRFDGSIVLPTSGVTLALRIFFVIAGGVLVVATMVALPFAAVARRFPLPHSLRAGFLGLLLCAVAINAEIAAVATFEPRYVAMQTALFVMLGFAACAVIGAATLNVEHR